MARRYFGWTTTHFGRGGSRRVNRYRRYGKKTYRIFSQNRYKPSSSRRFMDYI